MACLFPKAPNVDAYWRNILGKVDAITDPPPESWDPDVFFNEAARYPDEVYCKRGGFLGDLARFDPLEHGVAPIGVAGDADQWLALRVAREALRDAGYDHLDEAVSQRTAVILGRGASINQTTGLSLQHTLMIPQTLEIVKALNPDMTDAQLELLRRELHNSVPPLAAETVPSMIPNMIVGRIANRLDLMGPSYTVDAACASSTVAAQLAVRDLLNGDCDLALAGGSQVWTPMTVLSIFGQVGALSSQDVLRPFDKDADGTMLGEGIGMLVLKRLSDAERDKDRIYAVIRGVGVASDGKAIGLLAPRVDGEELALRRAYANAGLSPSTIRLIEAHGTGTPVGDVTEIQALGRVFGARQGQLPSIAIGSVKSMISHTIAAAGVASLIKTTLALHQKVLPPTLHVDEPNPRLEMDSRPFYINTEPRPWIQGDDEPRRAGVSAFGFGGINTHVVLEEYRPPAGDPASPLPEHRPSWDSEVCVLAASTPALLRERALALQAFVRSVEANVRPDAARLEDIAWTLAQELEAAAPNAKLRLAIVATSLSDLDQKIERAVGRLADPECHQIQERAGIYYTDAPPGPDAKIAFLFPGEGSQYAGMLADLCLHFPEARACFDRADRNYLDAGRSHVPSDFIFPRASFSSLEAEWAEHKLWEVDGAIASVVAADEAVLSVLTGLGVKPDALVGHSAGEWAALMAAGVFGDAAGQRSVGHALLRNHLDTQGKGIVPSTALLAIGAERAEVEALLSELGVEALVALDNCPHQVVVAVPPPDIERVIEATSAHGFIVQRLSFDRPYHTRLYAPFAEHLFAALEPVELHQQQTVVYSCVTAAPFPDDPAVIRSLMAEQWATTVAFRQTIEAMFESGVRLFVEVGPGGNLTSFVEDTLRKRPAVAIAGNLQRRSGLLQINHVVGLLAAQGVPLDFSYLYRWRRPRRLDWQADAVAAKPNRTNMALDVQFPMLHLSDEAATSMRPVSAPVVAAAVSMTQPVTTAAPTVAPPAVAVTAATPAAVANVPLTPLRSGEPAATSVSSFLTTMEYFLSVQQKVMQSYLAGGGRSVVSSPPVVMADVAPASRLMAAPPPAAAVPLPTPVQVEIAPEVTPTMAPVPPAPLLVAIDPVDGNGHGPEPVGPQSVADHTTLLLDLVSERTGYPAEAIGLDADLEADLGIDSIKRVEILGAFRQQAGLPESVDLELLSSQRSLRQVLALADWQTEPAR